MVDFETVKTLGTAIASIKTITDIAATITNAQLRQDLNGRIADLQHVILAAQQQMLEMQEKYERVLEENKALKKAAEPRQNARIVAGCYHFEGDEAALLFCTACYDTKGRKNLTTRLGSKFRQCPVCQAKFG